MWIVINTPICMTKSRVNIWSDRPKSLPDGMGKALSVSRELLMEIVRIAGSIDFAIRRPIAVLRAGAGAEIMHRERMMRERQKSAVTQLRRQRLIVTKQDDDGWRVRLTLRGADAALRQEMLCADMLDNGSLCIAVFDIPESRRVVRRQVGRFLLNAGFVRLQRSVFLSPFDVFTPLEQWIRIRGLTRWVQVYRAEKNRRPISR